MDIKEISKQIVFLMRNMGVSFDDAWENHVSDRIKSNFNIDDIKRTVENM